MQNSSPLSDPSSRPSASNNLLRPPAGAPEYGKYDIEAWISGRRLYGKVSSASDCIDYQSRRLCVRDVAGLYLHIVNCTACAAPRILFVLV